MIEIDTIPIAPFNQTDTICLIPTAYIDEPAMSPLADNDDELGYLEGLEGLTSPRRRAGVILPPGVYPDELLTERHGYGWTHVNAAFCYTRSTGNRFNSPDRGAWYATWGETAVETAHSEVRWHLTRELDAVGVYENLTTYRELLAAFATQFHNLHDFRGDPIFDPDPARGYPAGQVLATGLMARNTNGILYPSVRSDGGCCLAAFRPNLVQNVRQGSTWLFSWSGARIPSIEKGT